MMSRLLPVLLILWLAAPLRAGVLDDIKSSAQGMRSTISDVKSTKDESKGVVQDADGLAGTPVYTQSLGAWKPAGEVPALKSYFAR